MSERGGRRGVFGFVGVVVLAVLAVLAGGVVGTGGVGAESVPVGGAMSGASGGSPVVSVGGNVSGVEGATVDFVVSLSRAVDYAVEFRYAAKHHAEGSNRASDGDYDKKKAKAEIPAGSLSVTVRISATDDAVSEDPETFLFEVLRITSGTAVLAATADELRAVGTILDNDSTTPDVTVDGDASAEEGEQVSFTLRLSQEVDYAVSVKYVTELASGNRAAEQDDFNKASGKARFAAGETVQTVSVQTTEDSDPEHDETFVLKLKKIAAGTAVLGSDVTGTGTIINDDGADLEISLSGAASAAEGDSLSFPLSFTGAVTHAVSLKVAIADGSTSANDYTLMDELSISAGATSQSVVIQTTEDTYPEPDESFTVSLLSASSTNDEFVVAVTGSATGTITNDDGAGVPVLTVSGASAAEGSAVVFSVALSAEADQEITAKYGTSHGSTSEDDYTPASGTVTFRKDTTAAQTITVQTAADTIAEPDETFTLTLLEAKNAALGSASDPTSTLEATGTITNDDGTPPALSIDSPSETEGTALVFTVRSTTAVAHDITVAYATSHGTADAADYTADSGTATIEAGQTTSDDITITTTQDNLDETDETLTVTLSSPINAALAGGSSTLVATGTIKDQPTLIVTNGQATEGNTITFQATLSHAPDEDLTIEYTTQDNHTPTQTGDAKAGEDYQTKTGQLEFDTDATTDDLTQTITVQTHPNNDATDNETFTLDLTDNPSVQLPDTDPTGTIFDMPTLTVSADQTTQTQNSTITQGDEAAFYVTLSQNPTTTVTVKYATWQAPGTDTTNQNYTTGTLTFDTDTTTDDLTQKVTALANTTSTPLDETFTIALTSITPPTNQPPNAQLGATATAAITVTSTTTTNTANTTKPTITIHDASATEGSTITFYATLSHATNKPVTADYATERLYGTIFSRGRSRRSISKFSADPANDYTAETGTITFPTGTTSQPITIETTQDNANEPSEQFQVTLSNPSANAQLASSPADRATGTIINPSLITIVPNVAVHEGSEAIFPVTRYGDLSATDTIHYTINDGTAQGGSGTGNSPGDYTSAPARSSLSFQPGEATKAIRVQTHADTTPESDRAFTVTITHPNIQIDNQTATGIITDRPTLTIAGGQAVEGGQVTFTATLSKPPVEPITVSYATSNNNTPLQQGDAQGGNDTTGDYTTKTGTLRFNPYTYNSFSRLTTWNGEETFYVQTRKDATAEENETFTVTLSITSGSVQLSSQTVSGTILEKPAVTIVSYDGRTGTVNSPDQAFPYFMVVLSHLPNNQTITVPYTISSNRRNADGSDPHASAGSLMFDTNSETDALARLPIRSPLNAGLVLDTSVSEFLGIPGGSVNQEAAVFTLTLTPPAASAPYQLGDSVGISRYGAQTLTLSRHAEQTGPAMLFTYNRSHLVDESTRNDPVSFDIEIARSSDPGNTTTARYTFFNPTRKTRTFVYPMRGLEANETVTFTLKENDDSSGNYQLGSATDITGTAPSHQYPNLINYYGVYFAGVQQFFLSQASAVEGNYLTFYARLSYPMHKDITFNYATGAMGDDAVAGSDYTAASGTITFPAGSTHQAIRIRTIADADVESTKTLTLTLSHPDYPNRTPATATGTIIDKPTFTVADAKATEGSDVVFTVSRSGDVNAPATVTYTTADNRSQLQNGDAQGGEADSSNTAIDYVTRSGTLSFAAGETTKMIRVPTRDNNTDGLDETFKVRLSVPTGVNAQLGSTGSTAVTTLDATGTIEDKPMVTISKGWADDGSPNFTINLSQLPTNQVTVEYTTLNSAATNGDRQTQSYPFTGNTGTAATIAPTVTSTARTVVAVRVSVKSGDAELGSPSTVILVFNDKPTASITGGAATEGNQVVFTVALSRALKSQASVSYQITDGSPGGSTSRMATIPFPAGTVVKSFAVETQENTASTADRTFKVTLTDPAANARYRLLKANDHHFATGTIRNRTP